MADGAASPLNLLEDFDCAVTRPNIAIALQQHEDAENYKRKMEEAYRQRDLLLPDIPEITRTSIGLLKKIYSKNPKSSATTASILMIANASKHRRLT